MNGHRMSLALQCQTADHHPSVLSSRTNLGGSELDVRKPPAVQHLFAVHCLSHFGAFVGGELGIKNVELARIDLQDDAGVTGIVESAGFNRRTHFMVMRELGKESGLE